MGPATELECCGSDNPSNCSKRFPNPPDQALWLHSDIAQEWNNQADAFNVCRGECDSTEYCARAVALAMLWSFGDAGKVTPTNCDTKCRRGIWGIRASAGIRKTLKRPLYCDDCQFNLACSVSSVFLLLEAGMEFEDINDEFIPPTDDQLDIAREACVKRAPQSQPEPSDDNEGRLLIVVISLSVVVCFLASIMYLLAKYGKIGGKFRKEMASMQKGVELRSVGSSSSLSRNNSNCSLPYFSNTSPLHSAWEQVTDECGRNYWWNRETNETSWKPPMPDMQSSREISSVSPFYRGGSSLPPVGMT